MSTFFCSDFHLGHKNIGIFRPFVGDCEGNTSFLINQWNQTITKNDLVYCLGDMAFDKGSLDLIANLKGRKILIKGNHDDFVSSKDQLEVFEEIHGMLKYKGMWLTHCPIHPDEMRGRKANLHGHTHDYNIKDDRYFNCCADSLWTKYNKVFVSLEDIRKIYGE